MYCADLISENKHKPDLVQISFDYFMLCILCLYNKGFAHVSEYFSDSNQVTDRPWYRAEGWLRCAPF